MLGLSYIVTVIHLLSIQAEWFEYNGSCYTLPSLSNVSFQDSMTECSSLGSNLAELETAEELSYIQTLVNGSSSSFWLGLSYNSSTSKFVWTRALREPSTTMWIDGEPNLTGYCVRLTTEILMNYPPTNAKNIYLLADNPCTYLYRSLCEKPADLTRPVFYSKWTNTCTNCCTLPAVSSKTKLDCAFACARLKECLGFQYTKSASQCLPIVFNTSCALTGTYNTLMYKLKQPRC